MALMAIQQERDRLQSLLDEVQDAWRREVSELQEARRLEALTIGQLTERVANLEERLEADRIAHEAEQAAQEVRKALEVELPAPIVIESPAPPQPEKRPSLGARMFGGSR